MKVKELLSIRKVRALRPNIDILSMPMVVQHGEPLDM